MISKVLLAGFGTLALALAFDGNGFAEKFEGLPKAVKATATANMNNAFPLSITSSKGEQGWDYQFNTLLNGRQHNIVVDENGRLVAVKDETDLASIPPAAKSAIEKQASAAHIVLLEKVTEAGQVSYGAVIRDDARGTVLKVQVGADGTAKSQ